ncbi:purine-nucleoside phosphorylase [Pseudactinotalea sp. HY160]|uniref:purine-nucleoside phosphorylase n=1 Tax=Pseudactinotalea sp. HY160 TaxID=2654490 RepID=UPI00128C842D|nr:purine-nucleoside phosphorylase [Pseudactinotalea sp. HY160]MPV51062.1 purine-nucleoside phosphorylase [Pseudactinotalea sp. HY160]
MTPAAEPDEAASPRRLAQDAARVILDAAGLDRVDIALVLGSGWGGAADVLGETVAELPAGEVPGFAASGVPGHSGTLRVVRFAAGADGSPRHALVLGARTHFYEGRGVRAVAHGVRCAAAAGAHTVVLTNGCGGLDPEWAPGTPVLISDHLNLTAASPLEGATFVDLTDLYSSRLRRAARAIDPTLAEGVYLQMRGPHYETPAEVRMARTLGADLVGMSTALEAIAAREAGLEILGLSLVTNLAAGISPTPLAHDDVVAAGRAAAPRLAGLLAEIVRTIA